MKTLTNIIKDYLYSSKVAIDDENFTLHLHSNPDFPTLKAISDTFDYFSITNVVANVPKDALSQLPLSFLAVISHEGRDEIVMATRKKWGIKVNGQITRGKFSNDDFIELWQGTVIVVEQGKDDTINFASKEAVYATILASLFLAIQLIVTDMASGVLSGIMIAGALVSLLAIREESGFTNSVVKKVCHSVNYNGGCGRVISSSDSRIFGLIPLSNAAAAFFFSELLILILAGVNSTFLFGTSILGLPIIVYSLYSQGVLLKQWCVLCLGISLLFVMNLAISAYLFFNTTPSFEILFYTRAALLMAAVYVSIDYVKGYVVENKSLKQDQLELYKFKKDITIFRALLDINVKTDDTLLASSQKISFGSQAPILELDAFTNPTCGFCSNSFKVYYKLLKTDGHRIRINLMFNVPFDNPEHISTRIASKAIDLYYEGKENEALEMLNDWFNNRDIQQWLGLNDNTTVVSIVANEILENHRRWAYSNGINYTPATVVNGRVFPDKYKIEDLLLLANDLMAEAEKKDT